MGTLQTGACHQSSPKGSLGSVHRMDTWSRLVGHRLSLCSFGQEKALGCGVWIEPAPGHSLQPAGSEPHLKVLQPSSSRHNLPRRPAGSRDGKRHHRALAHHSCSTALHPQSTVTAVAAQPHGSLGSWAGPAAPSSRAKVESLVKLCSAQGLSLLPMASPAAAGAVWVALACPGTGMAPTLLHPPICPGCSLAMSPRAGQRPAAIQGSQGLLLETWASPSFS